MPSGLNKCISNINKLSVCDYCFSLNIVLDIYISHLIFIRQFALMNTMTRKTLTRHTE